MVNLFLGIIRILISLCVCAKEIGNEDYNPCLTLTGSACTDIKFCRLDGEGVCELYDPCPTLSGDDCEFVEYCKVDENGVCVIYDKCTSYPEGSCDLVQKCALQGGECHFDCGGEDKDYCTNIYSVYCDWKEEKCVLKEGMGEGDSSFSVIPSVFLFAAISSSFFLFLIL
jgi:hypothetical protein